MEMLHALRAWVLIHADLQRDGEPTPDQRTWSNLYRSASANEAPPPCEICRPTELLAEVSAIPGPPPPA